MRYKTVKDVIEFVGNLKAKDTADSKLKIRIEFYSEGLFVAESVRHMWSDYMRTSVRNDYLLDYLLDYFVTDFKIEMREYCIAFVLSIKEPSSI